MKKTLVPVFCVLALLFAVGSAQAVAINLTYGDAYYVGYVDDGIPPSYYDTYVGHLITLATGATDSIDYGNPIGVQDYSRVGSTLSPLPALSGTNTKIDTSVGPTLTVDSITYILAKYDGPNAGLLVWYLGALSDTDTVTLATNWGPSTQQYGISNYATWGGTSVPEPGTLLLLGSGLIGLAMFRKKLSM